MDIKEIEKMVSETLGRMDVDTMISNQKEYGVDEQSIVDFFKENPNPDEMQVEQFATEVGMEKEELERKIYDLLTGLLNGQKELSDPVDVSGKDNEKKLRGGDEPDSQFDPEQLRNGIKVESEHTDNPEIAKQIAKAHLLEDPDYYVKLAKMESPKNEIVEGIEVVEWNPYEEELLGSMRDPSMKFLMHGKLDGPGMKKALEKLEQEKNFEPRRNAEIMDGIIDKLQRSLGIREQSKMNEKLSPQDQVKAVRKRKVTQKLNPEDMPTIGKPSGYTAELWKSSNYIPLEQVKLLIAQTLNQFKGKMSPDTMAQLQSVLDAKAEKGVKQMESKKIQEIVAKAIMETCKKHGKTIKEVFDFEPEVKSVKEELPPEQAQGGDPDAANELMMFIENDADLLQRSYVPMVKNLATKKARGVYDPDMAIKLFMYLADTGAQKYQKEMGDTSLPWHKAFPKSVRLDVAKQLRDKFQQEVSDKSYDYDSMLPKKYKGTELVEKEITEMWNKKSSRIGGLLMEKMGIKGDVVEEEEVIKEELSDEQIEDIYRGTFASEEPCHVEMGEKEQIAEVAPPGREKQVKTLKKELPKTYTDKKTGEKKESNPWSVAWSQYKKGK
ncbi:MAG: DUF5661 family protein [Nanoarchaeota archaeon]|nr:DUF5661 family protein [Nanoarchaeota archaeon]